MKPKTTGKTVAELRARAFRYVLRARQSAERAEALYRAADRREAKELRATMEQHGAPPLGTDCVCGPGSAGDGSPLVLHAEWCPAGGVLVP